MHITIDIGADTAIFQQLIDQIKLAVSDGELVSGSPLPSIRQLANDLGINQNTVAKAYRVLERDNIIVTRGYRGTFIHAQAQQNCAVNLTEEAQKQLAETVNRLRDLGLTDSEIRIAFSAAMKLR